MATMQDGLPYALHRHNEVHGNRLPWQYKAILHCCHVTSTFSPC